MKYVIENKEQVRKYIYGKDKGKQKIIIDILLMLISSTCTCVEQLLWKMASKSSENPLYVYLIVLSSCPLKYVSKYAILQYRDKEMKEIFYPKMFPSLILRKESVV